MFSSGTEGLIVFRENGITEGGSCSSKPYGTAKIRRSALGDFLSRAYEFTRLCNAHVQTGKGNEFVRCIEAVDVTDLTEDDSTEGIADTGDGSNKRICFF